MSDLALHAENLLLLLSIPDHIQKSKISQELLTHASDYANHPVFQQVSRKHGIPVQTIHQMVVGADASANPALLDFELQRSVDPER